MKLYTYLILTLFLFSCGSISDNLEPSQQSDNPANQESSGSKITIESFADVTNELDDFINVLTKYIINHDWNQLIKHCEPENVEIQIEEFGIEAPQYIYELLGFTISNKIELIDEENGNYIDRIDAIESVEWQEISGIENGNDTWINLSGIVVYGPWSTEAGIYISITKWNGKYYLTGAVG